MNIKTSVYIAASVDGFIAKKNGATDWLHHPEYDLPNEDFGYNTFIDSVDALVMGRNTFEQILTFENWLYSKPVMVLSTQELAIPEHLKGKVEHHCGSPRELLQQFSSQGWKHLYIDGGKTIQQFLRAGLIDQLIITRIPILLGQGISLFGPEHGEIALKHISSASFGNGFVQDVYEPVNKAITP